MSVSDIQKKIADLVAAESKNDPPSLDVIQERRPFDIYEIITCARESQVGDALMYINVNHGKFLYNRGRKMWLKWVDHHWEDDLEGADALAAMEQVVNVYRKTLMGLRKMQNGDAPADPSVPDPPPPEDEDLAAGDSPASKKPGRDPHITALNNKISQLHTAKHRDAVLKVVRTCRDESMRINGKEMDRDPWVLACTNGILELKLENFGFRAGRPDDYISCFSPTIWHGLDVPCPSFDQFLLDILGGDEEMVAYLWRVLGLALIGEQIERVFLVLNGPGGANGKTTLMDVLGEVLGDQLMAPIPAEMLLDQGFAKNPGGPAPDVMSLKNRRIVHASETDEGRRFSPAKVKWLSGREKLMARAPHEVALSYWYSSHFLILLTNELPQAKADDHAFWSRMHLINLRYQFLLPHQFDEKNEFHRKADPYLPQKLRAEASGILAGLVRGCLEYQKNGLNPPVQILEATQAYRDSEDVVGRFIRECCRTGPDFKIQSSDFYDAFFFWYGREISRKVRFTNKRFSDVLAKKGFEKKKISSMYWLGLDISDEFRKELDKAGDQKGTSLWEG